VDFRPERGVPFRAFADLCVRRAVLTGLTAARVEARARLRRLRELPARLSERERVVLACVLAGASLADAGAGLGANPTKLADNALTRARRKARVLLALEDAA
jgi:hypothetical protein